MISKPTGYDEAQAKTGENKPLTAGAYECVIIKAEECTTKTGRNQVRFDIDILTSEYKGYFNEKFNDSLSRSQTAYWQGVYYQLTEDKSLPYFKGLIENIEKSNPGFRFDWNNPNNEKTLAGKKIGGVFRREQFQAQDGTIKLSTKCWYLCDFSKVKDIDPPEDKLLTTGGAISTANKPNSAPKFEEISTDEDLPF
jgi:hypothetical protein